MTECKHGLEEDWCATCKHGPARSEREEIEFAFDAKYEGQCPECDLPIVIGQRCCKTTKNRVLHKECMES